MHYLLWGKNSVLPATLVESVKSEVSLAKVDNAGYAGSTTGTSDVILALISGSSNWLTRSVVYNCQYLFEYLF